MIFLFCLSSPVVFAEHSQISDEDLIRLGQYLKQNYENSVQGLNQSPQFYTSGSELAKELIRNYENSVIGLNHGPVFNISGSGLAEEIIKNYQNQIDSIQEEIDDYQERVAICQEQINFDWESLDTFMEENEFLEGYEDNIAKHQKSIYLCQKEIEVYQEKIETLQQEIEELQKNINQYQQLVPDEKEEEGSSTKKSKEDFLNNWNLEPEYPHFISCDMLEYLPESLQTSLKMICTNNLPLIIKPCPYPSVDSDGPFCPPCPPDAICPQPYLQSNEWNPLTQDLIEEIFKSTGSSRFNLDDINQFNQGAEKLNNQGGTIVFPNREVFPEDPMRDF